MRPLLLQKRERNQEKTVKIASSNFCVTFRWTDEPMDMPSYRYARMHLERLEATTREYKEK